MHSIIPVAGVGTRLRPHTFTLPKVLVPVAGKPILGHILDRIISAGVTSTTIVVGYLGDLVERYVRESYPDLNASFVVQEELLGLGHSIWVAREYIPRDGSPLFIVLGDTIFDADLEGMFSQPTSALCVKPVEDPRRFGVAEVADGYIERLVEKPEHPRTNLAVVGLYWLRNPALLAECLDEIVSGNKRTKNEYQLTDALQMMIERGERFSTFEIKGWFDCGKPETLLETNRHLLGAKDPAEYEQQNFIVVHPSTIAPNAIIDSSIVGPFASIGAGAIIRNAVIRDSIIAENAIVENLVIENSIVGAGAIARGKMECLNIGAMSEVTL